ncbi:hypothetical protein FRC00_001337 [Tulasnella sp. 408]|nr:hypothetical protein FRC00_001337 [Tulasnella sp. 408]
MKPTRKSPKRPGYHARERSLTLPSSSDDHGDPKERFSPRPTQLAGLIPKLKALNPTQESIDHVGLVRPLQFSPDGKWLATCSWDRKAIIWKVEATLTQHRVLAHAGAGFLSQAGVLKQTISFKTKIEAGTWMPTGGSFACVEGSVVHIMDVLVKIKADHIFERLDIHDVAVTQDEQRMILVATLHSLKDDLKPSKSKAEKRIIEGDIHIWDRETGLVLHSLQGANMVDNTSEDLTGVAWNHCTTGKYMYASTTNDGTVAGWTPRALCSPSDKLSHRNRPLRV